MMIMRLAMLVTAMTVRLMLRMMLMIVTTMIILVLMVPRVTSLTTVGDDNNGNITRRLSRGRDIT